VWGEKAAVQVGDTQMHDAHGWFERFTERTHELSSYCTVYVRSFTRTHAAE
jgi:hypothetical protein